jgi:hypothetical protein
LALEHGYRIKQIHRQIIYSRTWYPFREYVDTLYAERLKAKEAGDPSESSIKLLLNSLYGKFGMRKIEDIDIFRMSDCETPEEVMKRMNGETTVRHGVVMSRAEKEYTGIYAHPILASTVTSYARIHMYPLINHPGVSYTDTDSVFSSSPLPKEYIGKELGMLKREHADITRFMFIRPKLYMIGDDIKSKGCPIPNAKVFMDALQGMPVPIRRFLRLRESIRRGGSVNEIIDTEKVLDPYDTKRYWEHDDLTGPPSGSLPIWVCDE